MELFRVTRESGRSNFHGVRPLTDVETKGVREDLELLHDFLRSRDIFPILFSNAGAVDEAVHSAPGVLSFPPPKHHARAREVGAEVNRALVNFLTAMRLYLDHSTTRLTRTYGKQSEPVGAFTTAIGSEFDTKSAYRILYKLRNYVQHCGMPINTAGVSSRAGDSPADATVHTVTICADVPMLLATFDSWGRAKQDLLDSGATIEPQSLVPVVLECLKRIEFKVFEAELPHLLRAGRRLVALLREAATPTSTPALVTMTPTDGGATMTLHEPPYGVLELLQLVKLEPDGRPVF